MRASGISHGGVRGTGLLDCLTERPDMSAVAIDRTYGANATTSGGSTTEMFVLEAVAHRLGVTPVVLVPGELTIGSGIGCDIRLEVPGVEERHCLLKCSRGRISVQALDRRTWHNNLPITQSWLRLGDRLAVGPVEFRVRAAGPWDVLPPPESVRSVPAAPTISTAQKDVSPTTHGEFAADRSAVDASLLQQIATLEATVARHQAAVDRLVQQPTSAAVTSAVDHGPASATSNVVATKERSPLLSVATVPSRSAAVDEERFRLQAETEANYQESNRKLAELSVREESLQRQLAELSAQWEQLHVLIARHEQEAAAWKLRQQQLDSREQELHSQEQRCELREVELASREQQLLVDTELTAQRQNQLKDEAAQYAQQEASWNSREQTLGDWANQLTLRETHLVTQFNTLDQRQAELEQQEANYRKQFQEAEANSANWSRLREATDSQLSQRAAELDARATQQALQADELARSQHEWHQAKLQLQEESGQLEAERARLAGWRDELEASATAHTARHQADAEHFAQQQALLSEREQAATELANQLTVREAELREQVSQLEKSRTDLAQREEIHRAQLQEAEETRIAWNLQRETEEAVLARRREELDADVARNSNLAAEFVQRRVGWEEQVSRFHQEQEQLDAERTRLNCWCVELEISAADLATEAASLKQRQEELDTACTELERVEVEVEAFERQLLDQHAELTERDAALTRAETECAWQEREWELSAQKSGPVPGDTARSEERSIDTLNRAVEQLIAERDVLATDLFVMSTIATEGDDESTSDRHVRVQAEQLRRDQDALQHRAAKLVADQQKLEADRQELLLEQQALEQQRQHQQAAWDAQQTEIATREEEIRIAGDALVERESELKAMRSKLEGEQESLQQLTEFMQSRHEELALLRADLERQLLEASTQVQQQSPEGELLIAELQRREQELDERGRALAQQEATLHAAQSELEQQRQQAEQERANWSRNRESQRESETDREQESSALASIDSLHELVQTELDQDVDVLSDVSEDSEHGVTDAGEVSDEMNDSTALSAAMDEEVSASNLRSKLAEMFNLDLSTEAPATPTFSEQTDEDVDEFDETPYAEPIEESQTVSGLTKVTEPEEEEYDSVESYMQRLLDRNRISVADFQASQPAQYAERTVPHDIGEVLAKEETKAPRAPEADHVAEIAAEPVLEQLPIVRPAIDAAKVREGLQSLRHVANNSARSAIARSKWNRMRAQLSIQGALAAGCAAIGGAIITGHWLELVGTSLWGWLAIAIGVGLAIKNLLDMWRIHRFQVGQPETVSSVPAASSPEPAATTVEEAQADS